MSTSGIGRLVGVIIGTLSVMAGMVLAHEVYKSDHSSGWFPMPVLSLIVYFVSAVLVLAGLYGMIYPLFRPAPK